MKSIRFGILVDGFGINNWQAISLSYLLEISHSKLLVFIVMKENSFLKKKNRNRKQKKYYLYNLYKKLVINRFTSFQKVKIKDISHGIEIHNLKLQLKKGYNYYASREEIERIKSYNLDFFLKFSSESLGGEILHAAKYGIWEFQFNFIKNFLEEPPFFRQILLNRKINRIFLKELTNSTNLGVLLKQGFFSTMKSSYRYYLENILSEIAKWPYHVCVDLLSYNFKSQNYPKMKSFKQIRIKPKNSQMLLFILKIIIIKLKEGYNYFFKHEKWMIGILNKKIQDVFEKGLNLNNIFWLPKPTKNNAYADPFGVELKNKKLILFENYSLKNQKGKISAFYLNNSKVIGPKDIIQKPYHLSYPYILEVNEDIYFIPESHESKNLVLYKCEEFPYKWKLERVLMKNINALDSTLFFYKNKWWLFCTKFEKFPNTNLYIYYANELFGPWYNHPKNPVKSDIRSSRPAGTPFYYKNILIRPAQNCAKAYGAKIIFNKIITLNENDFKELPLKELKIGKNFDGIHTISSIGNNTLIDVKFFKFNFEIFKINLRSLLKKRKKIIKSLNLFKERLLLHQS